MHEKRNFRLVILLTVGLVWGFAAWFLLSVETAPLIWGQRIGSSLLLLAAAVWLIYALKIEDKLPDYLAQDLSHIYYEVDGLSFMPTVRVNNGQAELCVYYQNRYENPVEAIVHLRPPTEGFVIHDGWRDVHFAFKASGGDFGVIHQHITVPEMLQGEVLNVSLAAGSFYPRGHGTRLRKKPGIPCGTLLVDWGGAAFKTGVHEVSGEIKLINPTTVHLAMPRNVRPAPATERDTWRQQQIHAGAET